MPRRAPASVQAVGYIVMVSPPQSPWFPFLDRLVRIAPVRDKFCIDSVLLRKSLSGNLPSAPADQNTYTWANTADIQFILAHRGQFSRGEPVYARRHARGHLCFCAKRGDEVLGYRWVAFDVCSILAGSREEVQFFPLADGQAYLYELFTYEKYRHRRIGACLTIHLLRALKEHGIKEVYNAVSPDNAGSMKIHLRLGFEPQRFLYYYRIRKWKTGFLGSMRDIDGLQEWAKRVYGIEKETRK